MSSRRDAALALVLAGGVHLAFFALPNDPAGAVASGDGGVALVSLAAASPTLAALVEDWDRPPEVELAPSLAELAPNPAPFEAFPTEVAVLDRPMTVPDPVMAMMPDAMPALDMAVPAAPEPEPEPLPEVQPEVQPPAVPETSAMAPAEAPRPKQRQAAAKSGKAPKAASASQGQAAQQAKGTGGGAAAGASGRSEAATLSKATINDLKAGWGASIRARIERKKAYPAAAKGASGKVTVRLTVNRSGQLMAVAVLKSSGHAALDDAAVRAVRSAGKFAVAPKGLDDQSFSFTLPMNFSR